MRPWLIASLLAHALWLAPTPGPRLQPPPVQGGPLQLRWLAAPAPQATANPPDESVLKLPEDRKTALHAKEAPAPPVQSSRAEAAPVATPASWPANARWHYTLQWRGEAGEAVIDWQQDAAQYKLRLERQANGRTLPPWQSEGVVEGEGLQPTRFSAGRTGREHTLWLFSAGLLLPRQGEPQVAPPGTQDRLSWMWQLAGLAARIAPRPGEQLQVHVAGWRGPPQTWTMRVEPDPLFPHWLHLRRVLPEGGLSEQRIWLDPARGHLPVRLEMRYDDAERWSLMLVDAPPVAAQAPSSP